MTLTKEQAMFTSDTAKYKIIGICTSCVQSDYVRDIVSSISRKGVKEGYKVLLFNTFCDLYHNISYNHGEASIFDLINYDILDVLIIMPEAIKRDSISNEISKRAHEHGVPVICVDSTMDNCCSVTFNYSDVFEKIVRHVIEFHGCRRVNFIAGVKGNAFSEERIEAYKKVLAENGIEFEPERLGYGDFWDMPTKGVLEKFLESSLEFPQAIICANDAMAIAACSILRERGIKVPEDVIVTGFDGIELEQYNSPRLTTAAVDNDVLGEKIINAIDHMMNGVPLPEKIEVSYTMRISQSCGCKKIDPREVGDKILELYHRMNNSDGHEQHMFSYLAKTGMENEQRQSRIASSPAAKRFQLSGFIGGILLFVVRGGGGCSIQRTAAQEGRELVRLHVHAAHQLNDLQVFLFSLCRFQFFQLLLVFADFFFEPFDVALNAGKSFCHTKSFLASR